MFKTPYNQIPTEHGSQGSATRSKGTQVHKSPQGTNSKSSTKPRAERWLGSIKKQHNLSLNKIPNLVTIQEAQRKPANPSLQVSRGIFACSGLWHMTLFQQEWFYEYVQPVQSCVNSISVCLFNSFRLQESIKIRWKLLAILLEQPEADELMLLECGG